MHTKNFALSIVLLLISAFSTECLSQEYWVPLPSPTAKKLNEVCFIDSLAGWVAGDSGTIIHTTTGGQTWEKQQSGISSDLFHIFMLNARLGWAVSPVFDSPSFETLLLTTTNGGNEWTRQRIPEQLFYALTFIDSLHGWMVGEGGTIVGTSDGGVTWFEATVDTNIHPQWELSVVEFYSPQYGYALGGRFDITGMTWRTTNGGQSWHPMVAGAEPLYGIHFFDSLNVMCVGGDFDFGSGMINTKDGGSYWNYTYLGIWGQASSLAFRTHSEAWSPLGFAGTYMFSADSGRTWADFPVPGNEAMYDVTFPDSLHGYMVGNHGKILKYNSSPLAVGGEPPAAIPLAVKLYQNYPNPFNPSTTIRYELSEAAAVTLRVYNSLGQEVKSLAMGKKEPGGHSVEFKGEGLASGVYFYQLSTGSSRGVTSRARQMMLMK